jgi:hypothetical protein
MAAACPILDKQILSIISNIIANIENNRIKSFTKDDKTEDSSSRAKNYAENLALYLKNNDIKQATFEDWFELSLAAISIPVKEKDEKVTIEEEVTESCLDYVVKEINKKTERDSYSKIKEIVRKHLQTNNSNKIDNKELTKLLINIEKISDNINRALGINAKGVQPVTLEKPRSMKNIIFRSGLGLLASIFLRLESMIFGDLIERLTTLKNQYFFKEVLKPSSKTKNYTVDRNRNGNISKKAESNHTAISELPKNDLQDAIKLLVSAGVIATDKEIPANTNNRNVANLLRDPGNEDKKAHFIK